MDIIEPKVGRSDVLGALASGLCAIHCTLTPLIFAAQPMIEGAVGEHAHGSSFWAAFDYIFLALSLLAVWFSARHTHHKNIKWILWISWFVFAIGLLSEPFHLPFGKWLMYGGSISLVITHLQNYRYCRNNHENC
ncbi:MAG: MerC domain-containing protein [Bacteroidota bacterium]